MRPRGRENTGLSQAELLGSVAIVTTSSLLAPRPSPRPLRPPKPKMNLRHRFLLCASSPSSASAGGGGGGQRASPSPPNPTRPLLSSLLYLPLDASVPSLRRWPRGGGNPWDVLTVDTLVKRVPDGARHDGLQRAWHSGAFFFLHRQGHPLRHVGQDFRHQLVITLLMTAKEVKGSMSDRAGCSGGPLRGTPPGGTSVKVNTVSLQEL